MRSSQRLTQDALECTASLHINIPLRSASQNADSILPCHIRHDSSHQPCTLGGRSVITYYEINLPLSLDTGCPEIDFWSEPHALPSRPRTFRIALSTFQEGIIGVLYSSYIMLWRDSSLFHNELALSEWPLFVHPANHIW